MLTQTQLDFLSRFGIVPMPAAPSGSRDADALKAALTEVMGLLARVRAMPPRAGRLLSDLTGPLARNVEQARKLAKSGDVSDALDVIKSEQDEMRALEREIGVVTRYLAEDARFQSRLTETRAHRRTGGAAAIEDYIERMEADEKRRQQAEARGEFGLALAACEAQDHRHGAMMQEAARGVEFGRIASEIEAEITRLEAQAPGGGTARPVIADIREMINDAGNFTKSDNWVGAVLMLRKARTELKVRTRGLELVERLRPEERDDDFDTNQARVFAMVDGLRKLPAAGRFTPELKTCVDILKQARAALPDQATALALLFEARRIALELTETFLEDGRYTSAVRQILTDRRDLRRLNRDGCVDKELANTVKDLRAADAEARIREFQAALDRLDAATETLRNGFAAARCYAECVLPSRAASEMDEEDAHPLLPALERAYRDRDLPTVRKLAGDIAEARDGAAA